MSSGTTTRLYRTTSQRGAEADEPLSSQRPFPPPPGHRKPPAAPSALRENPPPPSPGARGDAVQPRPQPSSLSSSGLLSLSGRAPPLRTLDALSRGRAGRRPPPLPQTAAGATSGAHGRPPPPNPGSRYAESPRLCAGAG